MPRFKHPYESNTFLGEWREYDLYFSQSPRPLVIVRFGDDPEDYASGINFAEQAYSYPLTQALALAKERGLYRDKKELVILPENDKPLYILSGHTGYYEDARSWLVRAFRDEKSARTYGEACQKKADIWLAQKGMQHDNPPYYWSALDPKMQVDERVSYTITEIPISLRPEEIASSWEQCPICRGQMYDTPDGRICENGHEAI